MSPERQQSRRIPQEGEREKELGHRDVLQAFNRVGYELGWEIKRLLLEEDGVFDNRKGSGYTQVTYHLLHGRWDANTLFDSAVYERLLDQREADGLRKEARDYVEVDKLKQAAAMLGRPESKMVADLIVQKFEPYEPTPEDVVLRTPNEAGVSSYDMPRVGSCTSAELYYLEFVNSPGTYQWRNGDSGMMNVITDASGEPILLEKEGLGDPYSCITLREVVWERFLLPPVTLMAVKYPKEATSQERINLAHEKPYSTEIALDSCVFVPLRITTLAIAPDQRKRAFGQHIDFQKRNGFPDFDTMPLDELVERANEMLLPELEPLQWPNEAVGVAKEEGPEGDLW